MKAVLLIGGKGTRLKEVVEKIPKPMIKIKKRPILEHNIRWLKKYGIKDLHIPLHHLPELIENHLKNGSQWGINIAYYDEPEALGTAGAVKNVAKNWRESFLVVYGDNLYPPSYNLRDFINFHFDRKGIATMGLYKKQSEAWKSGVALLDENNLIVDFIEKSPSPHFRSNLINTGIYVVGPAILNHIPDGYSDFGRDIFPKLLKNKLPLYGFIFEGSLIAIDTPELYKKAKRRI